MQSEWRALGALKKPQCGAIVLETDNQSIHTSGGRKIPPAGPMPQLARAKKKRPGPTPRKNHSPASTSIQTGTPPGYITPPDQF
jgi:hypothetical protein